MAPLTTTNEYMRDDPDVVGGATEAESPIVASWCEQCEQSCPYMPTCGPRRPSISACS